MLLALGILAMTVGLIRSEAAGDVRTLTATGASSATRRMLTAATAGGLAILGVALGTAGAYAAVVGRIRRRRRAHPDPRRPPRRDRRRHANGRRRRRLAPRRPQPAVIARQPIE